MPFSLLFISDRQKSHPFIVNGLWDLDKRFKQKPQDNYSKSGGSRGRLISVWKSTVWGSTFTSKRSHPLQSPFLPSANEVCEGYVFTDVCLSTAGGGRHPPGRYTPSGRYTPWEGTPPGKVHPRASTPPGQVHPLGRYTPLAGTPRAGTPPTPQAGGTHPTGIQSCSGTFFFWGRGVVKVCKMSDWRDFQCFCGPSHSLTKTWIHHWTKNDKI